MSRATFGSLQSTLMVTDVSSAKIFTRFSSVPTIARTLSCSLIGGPRSPVTASLNRRAAGRVAQKRSTRFVSVMTSIMLSRRLASAATSFVLLSPCC